MPAARRLAVLTGAIAAFLFLPLLSAEAGPREDAAMLSRTAVIVSMFEGRTLILSDDRLLAVAPLSGELASARQPRPFDCGPYGCRHGWRTHGGYYDAPFPPEIVLAGPDLRLAPVAHPVLSFTQQDAGYDPTRDQWRILYERTGRLETNPSPAISTAALLGPLRAIDPVVTASVGTGPVLISLTRRSERMVTADVQKLLAGMGHDPGPTDGLPGPMTRSAVLAFQKARGIEPTGRITPGLTEAIYRAAGAERPASGRLIVTRAGRKLFESPIAIDEPDTALGTHVLVLSKDGGRSPQWRLLTLSGRLAALSASIFQHDAKSGHAAATGKALDRIRVPAEARAKLAQLAGSQAVFVVSDAMMPEEHPQFTRQVWR